MSFHYDLYRCRNSSFILYAYNYNWDDGFEEPTRIMQNPNCSMSTALTLFYLADGVEYLSDREREVSVYQQDWWKFVTILYNRIIKGAFPSFPIKFDPRYHLCREI